MDKEAQDLLVERLRMVRERCKKNKDNFDKFFEEAYGAEIEGRVILGDIYRKYLSPNNHHSDMFKHIHRLSKLLHIETLPKELWTDEEKQAMFLYDLANFPLEMIQERIKCS